jgi:hypothetical protein
MLVGGVTDVWVPPFKLGDIPPKGGMFVVVF